MEAKNPVSKAQQSVNSLLGQEIAKSIFRHRVTTKHHGQFLEIQIEALNIHTLLFYDEENFLESLKGIISEQGMTVSDLIDKINFTECFNGDSVYDETTEKFLDIQPSQNDD